MWVFKKNYENGDDDDQNVKVNNNYECDNIKAMLKIATTKIITNCKKYDDDEGGQDVKVRGSRVVCQEAGLPANATQLSPQSGDRDEEDGVDAGDVVVVVNDRDGDDDGVDLVAVVVVVVDGDDDGGKIFPGGLEKTCPSVKTHAIFHFPPPDE